MEDHFFNLVQDRTRELWRLAEQHRLASVALRQRHAQYDRWTAGASLALTLLAAAIGAGGYFEFLFAGASETASALSGACAGIAAALLTVEKQMGWSHSAGVLADRINSLDHFKAQLFDRISGHLARNELDELELALTQLATEYQELTPESPDNLDRFGEPALANLEAARANDLSRYRPALSQPVAPSPPIPVPIRAPALDALDSGAPLAPAGGSPEAPPRDEDAGMVPLRRGRGPGAAR